MDIGTWVKAGPLIGIVSKIEQDGSLVVFNPGDRQMLRATPGAVQVLPTGTVQLRFALQIDVPHGLGEDSLRRWMAALIDPVLRAHAQATMIEQGLDDGPFMLDPTIEVTEVPGR
ncbi:MAG TPA: hypothetical protein VMM13_10420 [Euzebya sp.]|nr:hypothetical protein [Euzebya sp.]